jgi:hypothetical protein
LALRLGSEYEDFEVTQAVFEKLIEPTLINPTFVTHAPKGTDTFGKAFAGRSDHSRGVRVLHQRAGDCAGLHASRTIRIEQRESLGAPGGRRAAEIG